jgi:integrase
VAADDSRKKTSKRRRGRGEGSVYFDEARQLWVSQVSLGRDPQSGKRRRETVYGQTKQEVQAKLLELQQRAMRGELDCPKMSLKNYLDFWLGSKKPSLAEQTAATYTYFASHILKQNIAGQQLADISAWDVAQLYRTWQAAGMSPQTMHQVAVLFRSAMKEAVRMGLLHASPAHRVPLPKMPQVSARPLDPAELAALLHAAAGDPWEPLCVLALDSGCRIGELLALEWADLDTDRQLLWVRRNLIPHTQKTKEPKTSTSRRQILLTADSLRQLQLHRQRQLAAGYTGPLIFPNGKGHYQDHGDLHLRVWRPLLARAGVPARKFHTLRHTCATLLLQAGVNIKVISERLGHADITVTLRTYAHVMPRMQETATQAMAVILNTARQAPQTPPDIGSTMAAQASPAA